MTLLATFQALLWRYTGQEDIVVGSPVSNRVHHDTEKLIGFFVNTLVLRADFTADLSFRELLRQTRDTTLHAYENRDVPFEKMVEEVDPERYLIQTPRSQALVT